MKGTGPSSLLAEILGARQTPEHPTRINIYAEKVRGVGKQHELVTWPLAPMGSSDSHMARGVRFALRG